MDAEYARRYRELYFHHWWWRAREELLVAELRRLRPEGGFGRILDVGCGDGLFFDRLDEFGSVEGVEPETATIDPKAKHRAKIHAVPFDQSFRPTGRYGLILMLDVLEHLPHPTEAVRHAVGLLEPHGKIVITVPAFNLLWTRHDDYNQHLCRYTHDSFAALAARSGLGIEHWRYFFHWTFPAKLIIRAFQTVLPSPATSPTVPPAPINKLLFAVSRWEQAAVRRFPLPFGSSLLVVGTGAATART